MLLLFDIDGTLLLKASDAHRDAMHEALRRVHGLRDPGAAGCSPRGAPTPRSPATSSWSAAWPGSASTRAPTTCASPPARPTRGSCPTTSPATWRPACASCSTSCAARDDVRLALVTGNFEPIARLKLRAAGIGAYFASGQGGFGSDHEDRTELPAIARRRAGNGDGPWPRERTLVIGDTPRDIACARADGVRVAAVATGPFRPDDLRDADVVVPDARGLRPVLYEVL